MIIPFKSIIKDLFEKSIDPDFSKIDNEQQAVRTCLIDLGFHWGTLLVISPINRTIYFDIEYLNTFDEALRHIRTMKENNHYWLELEPKVVTYWRAWLRSNRVQI